MFFKCSSQRSVEEPALLTMRYKIIREYPLCENDLNKFMMDVPEASIKILYHNRHAVRKLALSLTKTYYTNDPYFNLLIALDAKNMSEFFTTLATLGTNVSLSTTHELLLLAHQQQESTKLAMPIAETVCESRSLVA